MPLSTIFGQDIRSLALTRILISLFLIKDITEKMYFCEAFLSDTGTLSRELVYQRNPLIEILSPSLPHFWYGGANYQFYLSLVHLFFSICLLIGYHTRIMSCINYILFTSLLARNRLLFHRGDNVAQLILMFGTLGLQWGEQYSVDGSMNSTLMMVGKKKKQSNYIFFRCSAINYLYSIQFYIVWILLGVTKNGESWETGNAVYLTLSNRNFGTTGGAIMLHIIHLYPYLSVILSKFTIWIEGRLCICLCMPFKYSFFRTVTIFLYIFLLLGLQTGLMVGTFPYSVICAVVGFLPNELYVISDKEVAEEEEVEENDTKEGEVVMDSTCSRKCIAMYIDKCLSLLFLIHIIIVQGPMIRDSSSITWEPLNPIIKPISNYITIPKLIQTQIISIRDNLLYYGDYVDAFDEGTDYSEGLKFFSLSQYWSVFNSPGSCGREWLRFYPGKTENRKTHYNTNIDLFQDVFVGNKTVAPWPLDDFETVYGNSPLHNHHAAGEGERNDAVTYVRPGIIYPTFRWRRFWSDMIFKFEDDETIPPAWEMSIQYVCRKWVEKGNAMPDKIRVEYFHACLDDEIASAGSYDEMKRIKIYKKGRLEMKYHYRLGDFSCEKG